MHRYMKYIENATYIKSLNENALKSSTLEKYERRLKTNYRIKRRLYDENNKILCDELFNLKNITEDTANELIEFADKLVSLQSKDHQILREIYYQLYKYYLNLNDINKVVEYIYKQSYQLYLITFASKQYMESTEDKYIYFDECVKYKDFYDDLSVEGKKYFLRSYGNLFLIDKDYTEQIEILQFVIDKKEKEACKDIPYDSYIYGMRKSGASLISYLRNNDILGKPYDSGLANYVYDCAHEVYLNSKLDTNLLLPDKILIKYMYYASLFHTKKINIDEFLAELYELMAVDDSYSFKEMVTVKIRIPTYILLYNKQYKNDNSFSSQDLDLINDVIEYIKSITTNTDAPFLAKNVLEFAQVCGETIPFNELQNVLNKLSKFRHKETFVHSRSVAEIMSIIVNYFLENNPSYFVGSEFAKDIDEVIARKEMIKNASYQMALYHDIGKYNIMSTLDIDYRMLFDSEIDIVRSHPFMGERLIKNTRANKCILDGIVNHHVWYDRTDGYPTDCVDTPNQMLVDILSVANTIDSSLDYLGRTFKTKKPLFVLIKEMNLLKGTRFSPDVIEALDDPNVYRKIEGIVKSYRIKLMYQLIKM